MRSLRLGYILENVAIGDRRYGRRRDAVGIMAIGDRRYGRWRDAVGIMAIGDRRYGRNATLQRFL